MRKKAYSIQMSYDITDEEKHQAEKAMLYFKHASKSLILASDHLNIMKDPFKENSDVPTEEIMKTRAAIRRFRDKSVDNFNKFKLDAFNCVKLMHSFSSDTQTIKLMKSFISSIDDLQIKVNDFVDLFSNLKSKEFVTDVVSSIENIQKQCEDIESIINERVKPHIQNNILASSWVNDISSDLQIKIEKKKPLIIDLFNQRQDQLNDAIKERNSNIQS
jgi:hypothetical protein